MRQTTPGASPIPLKQTHRVAAGLLFTTAAMIRSLTVWTAPPGQGTAPEGSTANCGGAFLSQVPFPFADYYSCIDLGSAPGVVTPYGGLTFKYDDSNTVLIGGAANDFAGRIYQIGVTRDANMH